MQINAYRLNLKKSILSLMLSSFWTTSIFVNINVIDLWTVFTFVLMIYFHYLYLLLFIKYKLSFVFFYQFISYSQYFYSLRFFHSNHHTVQIKIGLVLHGFKSLIYVSILFPIEIQRMFRIIFFLKFID